MAHLGEVEWQSGWRIKGDLTTVEANKLANDLIQFVGMTPEPPVNIRTYPNDAGLGGVGLQLYQPLTESWLIIGTWPEHGFFRVNLSSCKPYDYEATTFWLAKLGQIMETWNHPL